MSRTSFLKTITIIIFVIAIACPSSASWVENGKRVSGRPIPVPDHPEMVPDGNNGALIAWDDLRGGDYDIYIQLIDSSGTVQWVEDGIALCAETGDQIHPSIASDGLGGALVAWQDYRGADYDIYVQKISAGGTPAWTSGGVPVCTVTGHQEECVIVSDGTGGAIIFWRDFRLGVFDIYAQRIDATGTPLWTSGGVIICSEPGIQSMPLAVSDGAGGAVAVWLDDRLTGENIYAQRIDTDGIVQWTANGISVCSAPGNQHDIKLLENGAGGAFVAWTDPRISTANPDIYAQRLDGSGSGLWGTDGLAVCTDGKYQHLPQIVSDGAGGVILVWRDSRASDGEYDLYGQRINSSGVIQWTAGGIPVCTELTDQDKPSLAPDGSGGAFVTWEEEYADIYAQRIDASGAVQWDPAGAGVVTRSNDQLEPLIVTDDASGAVVLWVHEGDDLFAQRIDGSGDARWREYYGEAICVGGGGQLFPHIVHDGSGGAILTWGEQRSGYLKAFIQRFDPYGTPLWAENGALVAPAEADQYPGDIISDGSGGAITTWVDNRNCGGCDDVFVQRIDAGGTALWTAGGVECRTLVGYDMSPALAQDGTGGAIVVYEDLQSVYSDIYAQRIDGSGARRWGDGGAAICLADEYQIQPQVVSDGEGGAVMAWVDTRSGIYEIYAQRVDSLGTPLWATDGIDICPALGGASNPRILPDGTGCFVIVFEGAGDILAQRLDGGGTLLWTDAGLPVCEAPGDQYHPGAVYDGADGIVIVWQDTRDGNDDIYAQRLFPSGLFQWVEDGIPLVDDMEDQRWPYVASDGKGGAVASWYEYLYGADEYDIYTRRINASDDIHWLSDIVPVCTAPENQIGVTMTEDGAGGIICGWEDEREGTTFLYADRIDSTDYSIDIDCRIHPVTEVYQPDSSSWGWAAVSRAVLLYGGTDVELCEIAEYARAYNGWGAGYCCPFDPDCICNQDNYLFGSAGSVHAILANWGMASTEEGRSLSFKELKTNILAGSLVLMQWDDGDDANGESHIVLAYGICGETVYILDPSTADDPRITSGCVDYQWLTDDTVHEPWIATLIVDPLLTGDDPAVASADFLSQNYPNPFNPSTSISFGISEAGHVSLKVYDVAGRLVRTLVNEKMEAGRYTEMWDGRDDRGRNATSGIYFFRMASGGFGVTRKMVLLR